MQGHLSFLDSSKIVVAYCLSLPGAAYQGCQTAVVRQAHNFVYGRKVPVINARSDQRLADTDCIIGLNFRSVAIGYWRYLEHPRFTIDQLAAQENAGINSCMVKPCLCQGLWQNIMGPSSTLGMVRGRYYTELMNWVTR